MKKKLCMVMLLMFMLIWPIAVSADEIAEEEMTFPTALIDLSDHMILDPEAPESEAIESYAEYDETQLYFDIEKKIKEALLAGKSEINISDMAINSGKYKLYNVLYFSPYLSHGIDASFYYSNSSRYTSIKLTNAMTPQETQAYFAQADAAVRKITSQVSAGMSDEEKALVIHDYFVLQYAYDQDNYEAGTIPADSYRSGGLFVNGTGVCQAYAYGYKYIMNQLGIECHVTASSSMNHAWNIIKIDGSYYHIDCTWDDPVPDQFGRVGHNHFLRSDQSIQKHSGWDLTNLVCNNTKYDNAYWVGVTSPILIKNGEIVYIKDTAIYKQHKVLKDLGKWDVWGKPGYHYSMAFSGLFIEGDEIYYNSPTEIRKMSLDGQEDTLVYKPEEQLQNGYIYGMRKNANRIEYVISKDASIDSKNTYFAPVTVGVKEMPFTDVSAGAWYDGAVDYVFQKGIMTGMNPTTFAPDGMLGRAQFASIIHRLNGAPGVTYTAKFPDVPKGAWFTEPVLWANSVGVVNGYRDGNFGPADNITREQMAIMMHNYAKYKGYNTAGSVDIHNYPDAGEVSYYAEDAMEWAVGNGIITGKGGTRLDPTGKATRAECAAIVERFIKKYDK